MAQHKAIAAASRRIENTFSFVRSFMGLILQPVTYAGNGNDDAFKPKLFT